MGRKKSKRNEERAEVESGAPASPLSPLLGWMILLLLVFGSYAPAMSAGFIWDDNDYVTENETLETVGGLGRIWFEIGANPQYYPLVHSMFWLEYRLWGETARGFHIVNMLLHAFAAFLLW